MDCHEGINDYYTERFRCKCPPESPCLKCQTGNNSFVDKINKTNNDKRSLSNREKRKLDEHLQTSEIKEFISSHMKKRGKANKTPGPSGLSFEFYQKYMDLLAPILIRNYQEGFDNGQFNDKFTEGTITLLPKKNKDSTFIKNLRPITLLNTRFKILTGVLNKRVEKFMNKLCHPGQKGFVKGRYMNSVTRSILDSTKEADKNQKTSSVVAVDFSGAFDCVNHCAIIESLKNKNFGNFFSKAIGTILCNQQTRIAIGNTKFVSNSGVRQGDIISPTLFVLTLDSLLQKISENERIASPTHGTLVHKVEAFADDLTVLIKGDWIETKNSISNLWSTLEDFKKKTGLDINMSKTEIVSPFKDEIEGEWPEIEVKNHVKILGSYISVDGSHTQKTKDEIITRLRSSSWYYNGLIRTDLGTMVKVWNVYIFPKVLHLLETLPFDPGFAGEIEEEAKEYLKGGKTNLGISWEKLITKKEGGGLSLSNPRVQWAWLLFKWYKNVEKSPSVWAQLIKKKIEKKTKQKFYVNFRHGSEVTLNVLKTSGDFWKSVEKIAKPITNNTIKELGMDEPLKYNGRLNGFGGMRYLRRFDYVGDLLNSNILKKRYEQQVINNFLKEFNIKEKQWHIGPRRSFFNWLDSQRAEKIKNILASTGNESCKNSILNRLQNSNSGGSFKEVMAIYSNKIFRYNEPAQIFKFRIINNVLCLGLYKGRTQDEKNCIYCGIPESLNHFLMNCLHTQIVRNELIKRVKEDYDVTLKNEDFGCMYFGRFQNEINYIITKIQKTIYKYRTVKEPLDVEFFLFMEKCLSELRRLIDNLDPDVEEDSSTDREGEELSDISE